MARGASKPVPVGQGPAFISAVPRDPLTVPAPVKPRRLSSYVVIAPEPVPAHPRFWVESMPRYKVVRLYEEITFYLYFVLFVGWLALLGLTYTQSI
jgi:hypothetical protein